MQEILVMSQQLCRSADTQENNMQIRDKCYRKLTAQFLSVCPPEPSSYSQKDYRPLEVSALGVPTLCVKKIEYHGSAMTQSSLLIAVKCLRCSL